MIHKLLSLKKMMDLKIMNEYINKNEKRRKKVYFYTGYGVK